MYNTSVEGSPGQGVYGVTGPDCPVQRDLYGEVAAAMRSEIMLVGAYVSKADWHAHESLGRVAWVPRARRRELRHQGDAREVGNLRERSPRRSTPRSRHSTAPISTGLTTAGSVATRCSTCPSATGRASTQDQPEPALGQPRQHRCGGLYLTPENPLPASLTSTVQALGSSCGQSRGRSG